MEIFQYFVNRKIDIHQFYELFRNNDFYYDWSWLRSLENGIIGTRIITTDKIPFNLFKMENSRPYYLRITKSKTIFPEISNEEFKLDQNSYIDKVSTEIENIL